MTDIMRVMEEGTSVGSQLEYNPETVMKTLDILWQGLLSVFLVILSIKRRTPANPLMRTR